MKIFKRILISLLVIIAIPVVVYALIVLFLTIFEYKPKDVEEVVVVHNEQTEFSMDDSYTLMTWNIGFAGLDAETDFFMDGGKGVLPVNKARVDQNIDGIRETINKISPDFAFFQEVDKDSDRSFNRDQTAIIAADLEGYSNTFANNYKVFYIPYPIPPLGKIDSGIMTLSKYNIDTASRIALPCPFTWPSSIVNLKRCLLVSRISLGDTGKELVLVNLHLEAYDNGEGKVLQTALLKAYLDNEVKKGNYVIVGGDFNQTFSNVDISAYPRYEDNWQPGDIEAESFSQSLQICMSAEHPTGRSLAMPYKGADASGFQFYVIDGFLVSQNIEVEDMQVIDCDFEFSDHNPVVLRFKMNK